MERRENGHGVKRAPSMGELKRQADAQALTLRAELRAAMHSRNLTIEEVARRSKLDLGTLAAFHDGQSINPRWQEKLSRWIESDTGG